MKTIALLHHPCLLESLELAQRLEKDLLALGASPLLLSAWDEEEIARHVAGLDLLITLGGDGTILRAGRLAARHGVPILGVKMGRLGFLSECEAGEIADRLPALMGGRFWLEDRLMLRAELHRNETVLGDYEALNDVVIGRGALARVVHLATHIDGDYLTTFVADGAIVATPTGSTAYSLAAGGPILPPSLHNIILTPIAPHLSPLHSLVLSGGAVVEVQVFTDHAAILTVDGQVDVAVQDGDRVTVAASNHQARFVRIKPRTYFYRTLMERLTARGPETLPSAVPGD